jgi:hypothetical protein
MNTKENNVTGPITLESIDASIRATEGRLVTNFTKKIDESIMASEERLVSKITIKIEDSFDELARMAQREFVGIGKRFETLGVKVDDGFTRVDRKFVDVQSQLDHIYNNYSMRREHELLSGRVTKIERRLQMAHR